MSRKTITSIGIPAPSTKDGILDVQSSAECVRTPPLLSRTLIQTSMPTATVRSSRSDISELTVFTIGRLTVIWIRLAPTACATGS